jgi:hypothetical protein
MTEFLQYTPRYERVITEVNTIYDYLISRSGENSLGRTLFPTSFSRETFNEYKHVRDNSSSEFIEGRIVNASVLLFALRADNKDTIYYIMHRLGRIRLANSLMSEIIRNGRLDVLKCAIRFNPVGFVKKVRAALFVSITRSISHTTFNKEIIKYLLSETKLRVLHTLDEPYEETRSIIRTDLRDISDKHIVKHALSHASRDIFLLIMQHEVFSQVSSKEFSRYLFYAHNTAYIYKLEYFLLTRIKNTPFNNPRDDPNYIKFNHALLRGSQTNSYCMIGRRHNLISRAATVAVVLKRFIWEHRRHKQIVRVGLTYKKVLNNILSLPPKHVYSGFPGGTDYWSAMERINVSLPKLTANPHKKIMLASDDNVISVSDIVVLRN